MSNQTADLQLDRDELAAWRGMLRVHAGLVRALDAELAATHGLPLTEYEVLLFLNDSPEGRVRMAELADAVLLSRSGLTRLVDRMEREGLLRREQCPNDARGWFAAITVTGRQTFQVARETHLAGVRDRFIAHFSREELQGLAELWERVAPGSVTQR